ncbi:uncharacterized protein LOC144799808 [Lissotriton helveticus]
MVNKDIETFERVVDKSIDSLLNQKNWINYNLSKTETEALKTLEQREDLTIKPADKGGSIVIMSSSDYENRINLLLEKPDHYCKTNKNEWITLQDNIQRLLRYAKEDEIICEEAYAFLMNTNPVIPALYGLPKVHKNIENPPMRPIVSSIGSLTEPLSKYADVFLQPLVVKQKGYIKDTTSMIKKIECLNFNPDTQILVTLDIEALYTNIPQDNTIMMIIDMLSNEGQDLTAHQSFIVDCITMVLKSNIFLFGSDLYRQVKGTSMGATCAPSLACLYVSHFEEKHIFNPDAPFFENISEWSRYIDDIFFIWTGESVMLTEFLEWLNLGDINLKFTSHQNRDQCEFLDIIIKHIDGRLNVELFTKTTDRNTMLHFDSNHPTCQKNNIPFGQFLRLKRNCTTMRDYEKHADVLKKKFLERGYPRRLIRQAYKKAKYFNRETIFEENPTPTPQTQPLIFVTNFSQVSNKIKNIVNRNWHLITNKAQERLPKPMFSFRRNITIRNKLVHTYRENRQQSQPCINNAPLPSGTFPCQGCVNCSNIIKGNPITTKNTKVHIKNFINCRTKNLIYLIQCPCKLCYVGETSREIRVRLNEHRSAIRNKKKGAHLTDHWQLANHTVEDLKWCGLETVTLNSKGGNTNAKRKKREQFFMSRFNSVRCGLNSREDWEQIVH